MQTRQVKVAIVAAEASGDNLGASLIASLKNHYPNAQFVGIAGDAMQATGCTSLFPIHQLSVMGIVEVAKQLPKILKIRKTLIKYFTENPPDIYIGIDAPDFNLPIEKILKKQGVLTVHYNSPTVWAWREKRIHQIGKSINLMLALFPFEAAIYEKHNIPVRFIGHPLADEIQNNIDIGQLRYSLGLPQKAPLITLMPGSRKGELSKIAPVFIQAATRILKKQPNANFIAPMVSEQRAKQFKQYLRQYASHLPIKVTLKNSRQAMAASDIVLLASGTATLEALLLNKPMVVAYKVPFINYLIGKLLIKIDKFALPNLLAKEYIVPEFIQKQCTPDNLAKAVLEQLNSLPMNDVMALRYQKIRQGLQRDASEHAAQAISQLLELKFNQHETIKI